MGDLRKEYAVSRSTSESLSRNNEHPPANLAEQFYRGHAEMVKWPLDRPLPIDRERHYAEDEDVRNGTLLQTSRPDDM